MTIREQFVSGSENGAPVAGRSLQNISTTFYADIPLAVRDRCHVRGTSDTRGKRTMDFRPA